MHSAAARPSELPALKPSIVPLPEALPDDPAALKSMLRDLQDALTEQERAFAEQMQGMQATVTEQERTFAQRVQAVEQEYQNRVQALYEQLRLQRQRMFGRSSESHSGQNWLFDEADALVAEAPEASEQAQIPAAITTPVAATSASPKARGKRKPLPAELPRVDVVHDVPEAQRTCPCGMPMVEIGTEVSEQLDIVPMQIRVLRHIRKRYGCAQGTHAPVIAKPPIQVLPKSNASSSALAMLLTSKYVDGLPLARFEYVLARSGVIVPRQTQARWVIGTAQALQPIANLMRDALLESRVIHMDETPIQVLKEPGRSASSLSYMWVQRGGPPDRPVILFDYDPSRSGQVPLRLLEGWRGYLMTDGYEAYNALARREGIERLSCWAHARRGFVDAAKVLPKGRTGRADRAVDYIRQLYVIERDVRDRSDADRLAVRQTRSQALLREMRTWLDESLLAVPPTNALGQALDYLHTYWPRLIRYTERGDLPMDNNPAENAIRPFVLGRKAWLFSDTSAGAHASALIYSLIETAKANGQEPYLWLCRVLTRLPAARTVEEFDALLPWNLHATD